MNHIYIEAILLVAVFSLMSIASIIISKRQAKRYQENQLKEKAEPIDPKTQRISQLLKLLNRGLLTNEEFELLKESISQGNIKP